MAFVYCAKRDLDHAGKTETGPIGPGAYDISATGIRRSKPSYAPFSTTSRRSGMAKGSSREPNNLPGPGSYNLNQSCEGPSISLPFKSRTKRFTDSNRDGVPGPGQYAVQNLAPSQKKFHVAPQQRRSENSAYKNLLTEIFRECNPTAPSIPAPHQSYGYETDNMGRMVPQVPNQNAPPATEDLSSAYSKTSRARNINATSFGASRTKRTDFSASSAGAPGPGAYDVQGSSLLVSNLNPNTGAAAGTAAFKSQAKRGILAGNSTAIKTPGPGSYISNHPKAPERVHESLQFFGSTSARFGSKLNQTEVPGPGQYNIPSKGVLIKSGSTQRRQRRQPKVIAEIVFGEEGSETIMGDEPCQGFLTSSERFSGKNSNSEVPGSGTYAVPSMVDELKRKLAGRKGVFGSTSSRFTGGALGSRNAKEMPGPGAYAVDRSGAFSSDITVSQRGSTGFASQTKRSQDLKEKLGPDPGSYNVNLEWESVYNRRNRPKGFVGSTSERFQVQSGIQAPGPGAYTSPPGAIMVKAPGRKQVFITSSNRFQEPTSPKFETPAPCDYDCSSDLNKKTYNVAFIGEE